MQHDPWGKATTDTLSGGFVRVPFGSAGGIYDEDTKLVRFGAREYDPETGRWLSKDEARFAGGWNFYAYAGGDPVNKVDPTGFLEGTFDVGAEIAKGALRNGLKGSVAGAAGEGLAGAAAGIGIGGYVYCLLVDCGNGPLGDYPAADEGPEEGGAPDESGASDAGLTCGEGGEGEALESKAYSCEAKCQANGAPGGAYYVSGSSSAGCGAATRAAKARIPSGQYPRHCSCSDTEGYRATGHGCESHSR